MSGSDGIIGFHATTAAFGRFDTAHKGSATGHDSAQFGLHFSAAPQIAATFAMTPELVDAGYDDIFHGSSSLVRNPMALARREGVECAFQAGARLLQCRLTLRNPFRIDALDWIGIVDGLAEGALGHGAADIVAGLREQGFDGIIVEGWDGESIRAGCRPSYEWYAETMIVFDSDNVEILVATDPSAVFSPALERGRADAPSADSPHGNPMADTLDAARRFAADLAGGRWPPPDEDAFWCPDEAEAYAADSVRIAAEMVGDRRPTAPAF